jgi:hypothetical protein
MSLQKAQVNNFRKSVPLPYLTLFYFLVYPGKGTGTAAIARVGGFIIRCLYEREQCNKCIEKLETINETSQQKCDFLYLTFETGKVLK